MIANRTHELPSGPIYLMVGVNNLIRGHDLARIMSDYEDLLGNLRGRDIVVQSVVGPETLPVADLNAALEKLARGAGADFLDLSQSFGSPMREDLTLDGVHLNAEGYRLWALEISRHWNSRPPSWTAND